MQIPKPVLFDGDMGGDDLIALMIILAHREIFDLRAVTTNFGNVDGGHALQNILNFLGHFGIHGLPVFKGALTPYFGKCMLGDDAYGENGVGGVVFDGKGRTAEPGYASPTIIKTVLESPRPVTIFATGPLTNIARAMTADKSICKNIESIIVMGGGLKPGPVPDHPERSGNITLHSEFNFFQDPYAANKVLQSGAPVTLMTLDATQNIYLDPEMRTRILAIKERGVGDIVTRLLAPVKGLDESKFGVGPFIHDPNVIIYALNPSLYNGRRAHVRVQERPGETEDLPDRIHGKMSIIPNRKANATVITGMRGPQSVKDITVSALDKFAHLPPQI